MVDEFVYQDKIRNLVREYRTLDESFIGKASSMVDRLNSKVENILTSSGPYESQFYSVFRRRIEEDFPKVIDNFQNEIIKGQASAYQNGASIIDDTINTATGFDVSYPTLSMKQLYTAQEVTADLIDGLRTDSIKMISNKVNLDLLAGRSVTDTMSGVEDILRGLPPSEVFIPGRRNYAIGYRAELIARTEVARVKSIATDIRLQQARADVPNLKFELDVAPDACDKCTPFVGEQFKPGEGPDIPIHPNCQCTKIPWIPEVENPSPPEPDFEADDEQLDQFRKATREVPEGHYQNVEKFTYGDTKRMSEVARKGGYAPPPPNVLGAYFKDKPDLNFGENIGLNVEAWKRLNKSALDKAHYVCHEIGHSVVNDVLNERDRIAWIDYFNKRWRDVSKYSPERENAISRYATTKWDEHFSEVYGHYFSGPENRMLLKNKEPEAMELLERILL